MAKHPQQPDLCITVLAVQDMERAKAFYQEAFGWEQVVDDPVFAEFKVREGFSVALASDKMHLGKYGKAPAPIAADAVSPVELYLRLPRLDEAIDRAVKAGATVLTPRRRWDWGEDAAYLRDPDGHVLVLAGHPGDEPQHG